MTESWFRTLPKEVVSEVDPNAAEDDELKKIADIARNLLNERFGDDFVFTRFGLSGRLTTTTRTTWS